MTGWNLPAGCNVRDLPGYYDCPYEITIDGILYAWFDDDKVFKYENFKIDEYDDGFRFIGICHYDDSREPSDVLTDWIRKEKKNDTFA